jgi:ubiquinone/menaquinone biosynthesis C-methylase UbiE/uncharacterized protein YbaR (Trm112 family)
MKCTDIDVYRCSACRAGLVLSSFESGQGTEIQTGKLSCLGCRNEYPIVNRIPRFVPRSNDADSFGLQWTSFSQIQLDGTWQRLYRERFFKTTEFDECLRGQVVLEIGCGAGSFTGIILETGARLFSCDLSEAVDACLQNHCNSKNLNLFSLSQADLAALPFAHGTFDKIVCLGVLQHCPSPEAAFKNIWRYLKPGGEIVVDCYLKQFFPTASLNHIVKHAMRIVTKRMSHKALMRVVRIIISELYDIKASLNMIPAVGSFLRRLVPIGELKRYDWTPEQMKQIKTLNVFDMLSAKYDNPQELDSVKNWIVDEKLEVIKCNTGFNGINAKARRPSSAPVACHRDRAAIRGPNHMAWTNA